MMSITFKKFTFIKWEGAKKSFNFKSTQQVDWMDHTTVKAPCLEGAVPNEFANLLLEVGQSGRPVADPLCVSMLLTMMNMEKKERKKNPAVVRTDLQLDLPSLRFRISRT